MSLHFFCPKYSSDLLAECFNFYFHFGIYLIEFFKVRLIIFHDENSVWKENEIHLLIFHDCSWSFNEPNFD